MMEHNGLVGSWSISSLKVGRKSLKQFEFVQVWSIKADWGSIYQKKNLCVAVLRACGRNQVAKI
jgi:hypothetical protein